MFQGLINSVKSTASGLILKYVARASVAVPFVIAAGFAVAALTAMLVQRFGAVTAYWSMAGGLAIIGLIASLVVSVKEHEEEVKAKQAEDADTSKLATEIASQAPLALLGGLVTIPGGGAAALQAVKLVGRNWPLVTLAALIGALFWPEGPKAKRSRAINGYAGKASSPSPPGLA